MSFLISNSLNSKAVITTSGLNFKYKDLIDFSNSLANFIHSRSLVFCLCQNQPGSLLGYVSFLSNKVVPLMLEASMNKELLNDLIDIYKPQYLWLPDEMLNDIREQKVVFSAFNYSLTQLSTKNHFILHNNLALLLTTSGSTGSPKLVRLSYENLQANAESIAKYLEIKPKDRPITTLPMSYSFGISIINSHLLKGATILLTDKTLFEKGFWTFFKTEKATSFSGVPYTFEMLKKLRFFRMDLPTLQTVTQAGGKLNNELNREFAEYFHSTDKRFFVMYGQTEATARMSYLPPEYSISKLGSMGIAIPEGEFSLIDESGSTIEGHEITGELVYRGRNVSMGYAECGADLIKGDENKGILFTGDLAKRDSDRFYYIVGRKKRFIKIFGNRVNLDETERLLKTVYTDCACVGIDDKMIIYITNGTDKQEVRTFISTRTGLNPVAFEIRHIDEIPKNASGKTIYINLPVQ